MKKFIVIISVLAIVLTFVACTSKGNDGEQQIEDVKTKKLIVTLTEKEDGGSLLVSDANGSVYRLDKTLDEGFTVGDTLEVEYDGEIQETHPARFDKIISVKKQ